MSDAELTELRRELEALQQRFDKAEALTKIGSWTWDLVSDETTWSAGMFALFELPPETQPTYATALALIHPGDRKRYEAALERCARSSCDLYLENRIVTPTGRTLDVVSRGYVIRDDAGAAIRMLGTIQNVTEQRRTDDSLLQLGTVIEQLSEGVLLTNADATIEYVNPAVEKVTGYTRQELLGATPKLLASGLHDAAFYAEMWSQLNRGETWTGRTTNRRKDGSLYVEDSTITPIFDQAGHVSKFAAVKRDVTFQLEVEERLRDGQRLESIGLLAGGIAHDFNNMLSVILGYSELALAELEPDHPIRRHLELIRAAGESSAQLTRQLLAFSRKQVLQPVVVDLHEVVRDTKRFLERIIGADVELTVRCGEEPAWVRVDCGQLESAVLNLATNARHAMPKGGVLTIESTQEELDEPSRPGGTDAISGCHAVLTVRDTGIGMSPETLARIFEPFFTTKSTEHGTGLGLASVHGFVRQSGGQIRTESQEGQGTSLKIYLPTVGPPGSDLGAVESSGSEGSGTVLLVEDHDLVRELNQEVLRSGGYTVLTAENGEQALRLLNDHQGGVDLLVVDLVLPRMSGRALVERAWADKPGLKVVFTSGVAQTNASDQEAILAAGTVFIHKPCSPVAFLKKIREALGAPTEGRGA